jgi:hypothetical protein
VARRERVCRHRRGRRGRTCSTRSERGTDRGRAPAPPAGTVCTNTIILHDIKLEMRRRSLTYFEMLPRNSRLFNIFMDFVTKIAYFWQYLLALWIRIGPDLHHFAGSESVSVPSKCVFFTQFQKNFNIQSKILKIVATFYPSSNICKSWVGSAWISTVMAIRIWIGIKMEIRFRARIGIKTMPLHTQKRKIPRLYNNYFFYGNPNVNYIFKKKILIRTQATVWPDDRQCRHTCKYRLH